MKRMQTTMVLVVLGGCGNATAPTGDASLEDIGVDAGLESADGGPSLDDIDPTPDPTCTGTWVIGVTGQVVNQDGPIAGARPQLCLRIAGPGTLVCLAPPITDDEGNFEIVILNEMHRCLAEGALRILLPNENYAATYCELDLNPTDSVISVDSPFALFPTAPATSLPPEGDLAASRPVVFADGLTIEVTPNDISLEGDYDSLAAGYLSAASITNSCLLAHAPAFAGVYGFSPEANITSSGFPITIPNTAGLPPNSTVELYVLGGLSTTVGAAGDTPVAEAEWALGGTATVGSDGAQIEGGMLPSFTWLGIKAAD